MILKREKSKLQIGNLIMTASRWPWQGYGWRSTGGPTAPLNTSGARFGGGWRYKLGIQIGSTTVLLDLLFGMVTLRWESASERAAVARWEAESAERRRRFAVEQAVARRRLPRSVPAEPKTLRRSMPSATTSSSEERAMKIVQLQAENVKRLKAVEISPEGHIVEITGRNGQGKSSVLDAIWWALAAPEPRPTAPAPEDMTLTPAEAAELLPRAGAVHVMVGSARARLDRGDLVAALRAGRDRRLTLAARSAGFGLSFARDTGESVLVQTDDAKVRGWLERQAKRAGE